jgi:hypothetical protein
MACEEKQAALLAKTQGLGAELQAKTQALGEDVRRRAEGIDPKLDTTGVDVWVGLDVDVSWKRVDFSIDLPQVTIKDQTWSLDLPQVTVGEKAIVFHTPSVRMVRRKTGEYPETTCRMENERVGLGIVIKVPKCTVRWSPIYMDVPEPFMDEQRIVLGIPEFRMDRTEFVLGVPEFRMERADIGLHLPQVTVKEINVEARAAEEKGKALAAEAEQEAHALRTEFAEEAKMSLGPDVTDLFYCYESDLAERRNEGLAKFEQGITLLQGVIGSMVSAKIPDDNDSLVRSRASLAEAIAARETFARTIEEKFKELHAQQAEFFRQLVPDAEPAALAA